MRKWCWHYSMENLAYVFRLELVSLSGQKTMFHSRTLLYNISDSWNILRGSLAVRHDIESRNELIERDTCVHIFVQNGDDILFRRYHAKTGWNYFFLGKSIAINCIYRFIRSIATLRTEKKYIIHFNQPPQSKTWNSNSDIHQNNMFDIGSVIVAVQIVSSISFIFDSIDDWL